MIQNKSVSDEDGKSRLTQCRVFNDDRDHSLFIRVSARVCLMANSDDP